MKFYSSKCTFMYFVSLKSIKKPNCQIDWWAWTQLHLLVFLELFVYFLMFCYLILVAITSRSFSMYRTHIMQVHSIATNGCFLFWHIWIFYMIHIITLWQRFWFFLFDNWWYFWTLFSLFYMFCESKLYWSWGRGREWERAGERERWWMKIRCFVWNITLIWSFEEFGLR